MSITWWWWALWITTYDGSNVAVGEPTVNPRLRILTLKYDSTCHLCPFVNNQYNMRLGQRSDPLTWKLSNCDSSAERLNEHVRRRSGTNPTKKLEDQHFGCQDGHLLWTDSRISNPVDTSTKVYMGSHCAVIWRWSCQRVSQRMPNSIILWRAWPQDLLVSGPQWLR